MAITRLGGLLIFARIMSIEHFGALALIVSISYILNNAQRSLVILPFIVSCRNSEEVERDGADWFWIDLVVSALVFVGLMAAWGLALALDCPEWLDYALLYSAIGAPQLMAFTFLRRWAYQQQKHKFVLAMVIAYVVAFAIGTAFSWQMRHVTWLPYITMAAAPLAGLLAGVIGGHRHWHKPAAGLFSRWRRTLQFSTWSFLSFLVGAIYTNAMNIVVAAFVGAAGSAAFGVGRTIVAPVVTLTSATDMIDKPRASRAFLRKGLPGLRRSVFGTLAYLSALSLPFLAMVFVFSESILAILYGGKYDHLGTDLRIWTVAIFFQMLANPLSTHFVVVGDSRRLFLCGLAGAVTTLVTALVGLMHYDGVTVALVAMVLGRVVNVIMLCAVMAWGKFPATKSSSPHIAPPSLDG